MNVFTQLNQLSHRIKEAHQRKQRAAESARAATSIIAAMKWMHGDDFDTMSKYEKYDSFRRINSQREASGNTTASFNPFEAGRTGVVLHGATATELFHKNVARKLPRHLIINTVAGRLSSVKAVSEYHCTLECEEVCQLLELGERQALINMVYPAHISRKYDAVMEIQGSSCN